MIPQRRILYHYGATDRYLKQSTGTLTDDLLSQAREGLRSWKEITVRYDAKLGFICNTANGFKNK